MLVITNGPDHASSKLAEQIESARPQPIELTFLEILWKKITSIVSKIFACFCCKGASTRYFNAREIKLLNDDRLHKIPEKPYLLLKFPKDRFTEMPKGIPSGNFLNPEPPYTVFTESLEELRAFLRNFSSLVVETIYENQLATPIKSTQEWAPSLPPLIKKTAKLIVEMGDKAAKPLFKKFSAQKAKAIDPALQKIFKTLLKVDQTELKDRLFKHLKEAMLASEFSPGMSTLDYINPLLDWFCSNEEQRKPLLEHYPSNKSYDKTIIEKLYALANPFWEAQIDAEERKLHEYMEQQLCAEFRDTKVPSHQSIEFDYIVPILTWLLLSNRTMPLNDLFGQIDGQKEELIDNIFERAISLIVERKIDQYSRFLEKTIQGQLDTIIQKTLQKNAERVADFFSERLSELIHSMPFTKMIDELIHDTIHTQIQGLLAPKEIYKEKKKVLERVEQHSEIIPNTPESLEDKFLARKHLHKVRLHGGKEAYLERMKLISFCNRQAENSYIQQIIKQELELVALEKDPKSIRRVAEKALCHNIAENILRILIPTGKKIDEDEITEENDPFVELWERLYLPEEFYDLAKQCEQLGQEFVTPETTSILESIRSPTIEIIKNIFRSATKDFLKKKLIQIVQNGIEKITLPEKINEVMSETVLNSVNLMLVEIFCRNLLVRNLSEFTPLFHQLMVSPSCEKDENMRLIQNALIKMSKNKFMHFNPDEFSCNSNNEEKDLEMHTQPITSLEWLEITRNIVSEIEVKIRNTEINHLPFDAQSVTNEEISDILKKIFSKTNENNNPEFGKLAWDIIFGLGKMDSEWLVSFLQKQISGTITESVEPWRESYHKLIGKLADLLKRKFLHPDAVKALFKQEQPKPAAVITKKLKHQLHVSSSIIHDILMAIANDKASIVTYGATIILTDSPNKLNQVITKIYKKLFSNTLINQNFAANACEKIFQAVMSSDYLKSKS